MPYSEPARLPFLDVAVPLGLGVLLLIIAEANAMPVRKPLFAFTVPLRFRLLELHVVALRVQDAVTLRHELAVNDLNAVFAPMSTAPHDKTVQPFLISVRFSFERLKLLYP